MPVVAVINRKGGSGKSTLATHLAAYCAHSGIPVMLGDVDKQQSTQAWLRLRATRSVPTKAPIVGWTVDARSVLRSPPGVTHVVLDTPGGLRGFELARVVMFADVIIMPVCNSVFDRESAAGCYEELMSLPRVASGKCKVAAVGMRLDARTKADEVIRAWAEERKIPFLGVLRETQGYVRCVEQGLTLFDLPPSKTEVDLAQWQPILEWLKPVLQPAQAPVVQTAETAAAVAARVPAATPVPVPQTPRVTNFKPAQDALLAFEKQSRPVMPAKASGIGKSKGAAQQRSPSVASRVSNLLASLGMTRLLQR